MDFTIDSVTTKRNSQGLRVVIYGIEGVGKTTLASKFPRPVLFRTEDGAQGVDVPMFPSIAQKLDQLGTVVRSLTMNNHEFKTLIIDSLDWLEPLVWKRVSENAGKVSIESFGYGKGYVEAEAKWREIVASLDKLVTAKGMNIVFCAHSQVTKFDPPDSDPYMRYSLKVHERAAAVIREWCDVALFVAYDVNVTASMSGRAKATGCGDRIVFTAERPAFFAKSRLDLPEMIHVGKDKSWEPVINELFKSHK